MMQNKRTLRKTNKKTRKNQNGGAAEPHTRRSSRTSGRGSRSSGSQEHYDRLQSGPGRKSTGSSSTRPGGSERHYSRLQQPPETYAMRTIINSAGLLKATGTKVFTNETGRSRTSYNPEAIKNILRTKGHTNEKIIQSIAKKVSNKGISATARQLGVEGYNRNLAKEHATQISLMHNPEQTSSGRKPSSLNQFVSSRSLATTPLTHINVSGQEQITNTKQRLAARRPFGSAKNTYNPADNIALLERSRTNNSIDQQSLLNARARILQHSPERPTTASNAEKVKNFLLFKSKHTQSGKLNNSNQELFADAIAVERKNKALLKKMEQKFSGVGTPENLYGE